MGGDLVKSYEALARVYDRLNGEVDYAAIAAFYEAAFARYGVRPQSTRSLRRARAVYVPPTALRILPRRAKINK